MLNVLHLNRQRFEAEKQRKRAVIEESKARSFREKEKVNSRAACSSYIAWDATARLSFLFKYYTYDCGLLFRIGLTCCVTHPPQRKRELGQASRAKSYVEEEKRIGRQHGMYSGFD